MNKENVIINFNILRKNGETEIVDLEVPINITANELVIGLNAAYHLGINTENIKSCYLKAENPVALLRGSKELRDYKIMNGTNIFFVEGES